MTLLALAVAACLGLVGAQEAGDCSAANAEAAALRGSLAEAKAALEALRGQLARQRIELQECGSQLSVIDALSKTSNIAGDVVQHFLQQTDLDDQLVDKLSGHIGNAKAITGDVVGKLAEVNYSKYAQNLMQHDLYLLHVAPAVGKVTEGAQPYMDMYVSPALSKAMVYTGPALEVVKSTYATAAKRVETNVLPVLKRGSSQAASEIPRFISLAQAKLGVFLDPVFNAVAKAAPKHAKLLPKSSLDRLLVLFVLIHFVYYALRCAAFALRVGLRLAARTLRLALEVAVRAPLALLRKLLSCCLCLATGFYCCGLCRRRGAGAKKLAGQAKKHGAAASNGSNGTLQKATETDLVSLLETSKKKGKLDPAVKLLCGMAGTGKPMSGKNFPENVHNKLLDKDTLKKALSKFKEVDLKKLAI